MDKLEMIKLLEHFTREDEPIEGQIRVTRVPDYKTIYIEQIGEIGRSIMMNEYMVDGKSYWAGYSSRSETVFVSKANRS